MDHIPNLGNHPVALAYSLGIAAYRAHQDIQSTLELAGFSATIAQATYNKIMSNRRVGNADAGAGAPAPIPKGIKRYVKNCMERASELKVSVNAPTVVAAVGTAGTIVNPVVISQIAQGSGDGDRDGNQIKVTSVRIKGYVITNQTTNYFRLIVFRDTQANGTTPAVTDILYTASAYDLYNTSKVIGAGGARFKILTDRVYNMTQNVTATTIWRPFDLKFGQDFAVTYTGNTGTATSVGTNSVWILAIAMDATTSFNFACQADFHDI